MNSENRKQCLTHQTMKLMTYVLYLSLSIIVIISSSKIQAHTCDEAEQDKAEYFAKQAGQKLVNQFGGGRDIVVNMVSCDYNSYSDVYETKIEVYWNGLIFKNNQYNIDGELRMASDGSNSEFSKTFANEKVKKLQFWGAMAAGAVVLGAIAVEGK